MESFKYYAFISYSHKDKYIAKKLQKRLEKYHLPSPLLKSNPDLPKKLSPIFIDESNLVAKKGTLKASLQENLERSNYLIVICSPNSAQSIYVNDEVEYFINLGRADHIIPLIVDGNPHAEEDPSLECFPQAILDLPREQEPLGIDLRTFGIRKTFLRVIATMLELDLDNFVSREDEERRKRIAIFTPIAAALMIAAGVLIWYNIPHYRYYHSYVYKFERPVGLFEIESEAERKKMEYSYRFTTLRGRVRKIERINSVGTLVNPTIITPFTEMPMINFVSDRTVEHYDLGGHKVFRKEYTKNKEAVDFYREDSDLPYTIQSDMLEAYNINKDESISVNKINSGNIIRLTLEHDENGYLVRKTFRLNNHGGNDSKGVTTQDENGRGGIIYTLDNLGRITRIRYQNKNRDAMSVNGVYAEKIEYGETPYPIKISYENQNGKPVLNSQGIAQAVISYDQYFNVKKLSCYSVKGNRTFDTKNHISEAVFTHDAENGFLLSESFYDTDLEPVLCNENYFRVEFERDFEGFIIERFAYDVKGERIVYSNRDENYSAEDEYDLGRKYYNGNDGVEKDYKKAFEHYMRAAERGHVEAQNSIGLMYENGYGVEKDYKKAVEWYQKSAEQGNKVAQCNLGYMYRKGYGVEQNYKKAVEWYQKAAEQGHDRGQFNLGYMYDEGYGVEQDYKKAAEWYLKAAEQGHSTAQYNLGVLYDNGRGFEQDYEQAVYWYRKAAKQGYASAQNNLGVRYEHGEGVEKDYEQAVYWYRKAAEQGDATAQDNLGLMYDNGRGVEQDYKQAVYWYRKAAEQGRVQAQRRLGYKYQKGEGVEKDYEQAVYWYLKAAEQGYSTAQNDMGLMYENGYGVEQDYEKAVEWYRKSAAQGYDYAQCNLGYMYEYGRGVEKDYKQALEWYLKSAEQGHARAQYRLALMYDDGKGVEIDYKQAVKWYTKAVEQGYKDAQNNLGVKYETGKGVERDYAKALDLYRKSAEQGNVTAQRNLGLMYKYGRGVEKNLKTSYMWYYVSHLGGDEEATKRLKDFDNHTLEITDAEIIEAKELAQKKFDKINTSN